MFKIIIGIICLAVLAIVSITRCLLTMALGLVMAPLFFAAMLVVASREGAK